MKLWYIFIYNTIKHDVLNKFFSFFSEFLSGDNCSTITMKDTIKKNKKNDYVHCQFEEIYYFNQIYFTLNLHKNTYFLFKIYCLFIQNLLYHFAHRHILLMFCTLELLSLQYSPVFFLQKTGSNSFVSFQSEFVDKHFPILFLRRYKPRS